MPKKEKAYGKQLRSRGGSYIRKRWTRIISRMRGEHKCPNCSSPSVKRDSVGIWSCEKCGYTFAGGAYMPTTKRGQASMRVRQQN